MRPVCLLAVLLSLAAAGPGIARAQGAEDLGIPLSKDLATQLSSGDVVIDDEAQGRVDRGDLEATVAGLQERAAVFKVAVLGDSSEGASPRVIAREVLARLGAPVRVMVYTTDEVGVASSVDPLSDVALAELAAAGALAGGSVAASVQAGGAALVHADEVLLPGPLLPGPTGAVPDQSPRSRDVPDGGPFVGGGLVLLVFLGLFLLIPFLLIVSFIKFVRRATLPDVEEIVEPAAALGEGERKVRQAVDRGGNLIIDLSDRIDVPDVAVEARDAFRAGARGFTQVHNDLEHADTRDELETIYPRVVEVVWQLETASALLDGNPVPPRPELEPLFPRREYADYEELPAYTVFESSPFFTDAAMTALGLLGSRGLVFTTNRGAMDDDEFWQFFDPSFPFDEGGTRTEQPTWRN